MPKKFETILFYFIFNCEFLNSVDNFEDPCESDVDCQLLNSKCNNGKCFCADGFTYVTFTTPWGEKTSGCLPDIFRKKTL